MKYSSYIDNMTAIKWGLNVQQSVLFDWLYTLPSWADMMIIGEGKRFYHASKNLVCKELPLLTDKPDTIYRYYKQLQEIGLIEIEKVGVKDYIHLTSKTAIWGRETTSEYSENNPSKHGNFSDKNTENFPTYKHISNDNNISKSDSLFPDLSDQRKTTFGESIASKEKIFESQFAQEISAGIDVWHYRGAIIDWSEKLQDRTKTQKDKKFRTAKAWISTVRSAIRRDKANKKLVLLNSGISTTDHIESLKMSMNDDYFD